ncbi:MAG: homoserine kinase [Longimicrobiales bacterium]
MIVPPAPLRLAVPASTSNLGPGYDVLGLALDRRLTVVWHPEHTPLRVVFGGALAGLDPARDLVHRTLAAALDVDPVELGGVLEVESDIPVARGLGSSAAARTAGEILARALRAPALVRVDPAPGPARVTPSAREALLGAVARAEGHPDNAVPALVGGFVAASLDDGVVHWTPLPFSPSVGMAYAAPGVEVRTDEARRVLPEHVPHADAVANGAHLTILLAGLARADGDRIAWGLRDRLHVPWRWRLVPRADDAAEAARSEGAWGVTLSGSGSGLLAFTPPDRAAAVAAAMDGVFAGVDAPGRRWAFPVARALVGATVVGDDV